jgi:copper homeostasis protein
MTSARLLELCVESVESALAGEEGGAQRVELCANLLEGGTTPSAGMLQMARRSLRIGISVMVRPRGGDFLYTDAEFEAMVQDVRAAKSLGADAVVFGLLRANGTVDVERTKRLVGVAAPLPVTFHRAIDVTRDPLEALEDVIAAGAARILTSGGAPSVPKGIDTIKRMVEMAGQRIIVMPGGGNRVGNIRWVAEYTGARELHIRVDKTLPSPMIFRQTEIPMGRVEGREYMRFLASPEDVRAVVQQLNG